MFKKFGFLVIAFALASCVSSIETKSLLGNIKGELKEKYSISNGDIIAKFDLQKISEDDKLFSPYYGKIINSVILNRKFLNDFDGTYRYKNFIQTSSYDKMSRLSFLLNNISEKYKVIPKKTSKSIAKLAFYFKKHKDIGNKKNDFLAQLAKLHESTKFLPIMVPMYRPEVSSSFGIRQNPFTKRQSKHNGIDLVGKINSEIYASGYGVVEQVTTVRGFGNMIVIKHNNVLKTRYAHLSDFKVKQGDIVVMGQVIGIQGRSGTSSGHHLHFEVLVRNKPVDPADFIARSL